jgi:DNA mismatch endonuclease (patch repair protein)
MDVLTPDQRRLCMSRVRSTNTKPELLIRRALFADGFRYRLHVSVLPGKPDLVLHRYRACIFVNGCFWHGHDCQRFRWPGTNRAFWETKITTNQVNDSRNAEDLICEGWRVLTIWECALRGKHSIAVEMVCQRIQKWLLSDRKRGELRGRNIRSR